MSIDRQDDENDAGMIIVNCDDIGGKMTSQDQVERVDRSANGQEKSVVAMAA